MDEVSPDEVSGEALGITFAALSSLQCVRFGLTHLVMKEFQRGRAEMAVLRYVLEHATKLLEIRMSPRSCPKNKQVWLSLNYTAIPGHQGNAK
jgi:hypothetical protein